MKKLIFTILIILSIGVLPAVVFASDIKVKLNGNTINMNIQPQIINGRTMLPVRTIFEALGANVSFDANTKTIKGSKNYRSVEMYIGKSYMKKNDDYINMQTSPIIINGSAYAPARYVAEGFGYDVSWDNVNKVVYISGSGINRYGVPCYANHQDVPDFGEITGVDVSELDVDNTTIMYTYKMPTWSQDSLYESIMNYSKYLEKCNYKYYSHEINNSHFRIVYYNYSNNRMITAVASPNYGGVQVCFTIYEMDGKLSDDVLNKIGRVAI